MENEIPRATHEGPLKLGDMVISCAVLEDGTRLITQEGFLKALGRAGKAKGGQGASVDKLPAFLAANNLRPFISDELTESTRPIRFRNSKGTLGYGYKADLLPKVCTVYLEANDASALKPSQGHIVEHANILIRALAHVGILALVDEATGYQKTRDKEALQAILDAYLRKELAAWAKRFPDSFYKEMFRLRGWKWHGISVKRPSVVGHYTNDLIYERLAPKILKELEMKNPKDSTTGRRKAKHHQWLTDDVGHPALAQHLHAVVGLMRASGTWKQFYRLIQRAFPKKGEIVPLPIDQD